MFDQTQLEKLVDSDDYDGGVAYCYSALASGSDPQHWKTQLGYVYFLDEENDIHYDQSISIFRQLTTDYPTDPVAYFWLGYIQLVLRENTLEVQKCFQQALICDPQYPYANLVISSYGNVDEEIVRLQMALKQQPNNYRALTQLADAYITSGHVDLAKETLNKILVHAPYYENDYGVMYRYINDVFTRASQRQVVRENTEVKIKSLQKG